MFFLQIQISDDFIRNELLSSIKSGNEYDVLVIGGGATGCGVALDACTRGFASFFRFIEIILQIK